MLTNTILRTLRQRCRRTGTVLILLSVPFFAVAILGSWTLGQLRSAAPEPGIDLALLVQPEVKGPTLKGPTGKDPEQVDALVNWKYTQFTIGS